MMKSGKTYLLIFVLLSLFLFFGFNSATADSKIPLRGFTKMNYKAEDTVSKGLDPNVLFLLDTSTAMSFAPWGVMPDKYDGREVPKREEMLQYSTYGHGMRPVMFKEPFSNFFMRVDYREAASSDQYATGHGFMRYGREVSFDKSKEPNYSERNNYIGSPDCYYTPDQNKYFLLTIKNRHLAHYDNWITASTDGKGYLNPPRIVSHNDNNLPKDGPVGWQWEDPNRLTSSWIEAKEALDAIICYIPETYEKDVNGVWVPTKYEDFVPYDIADKYLVPNDSRLYKMKIALWRMTDYENREMLARMNIASAISYQTLTTMASGSTATKVAPYGYDTRYPNRYKWGLAANYVTGDTGRYENPEYVTRDSQWTRRGVLMSEYQGVEPTSLRFKSMTRAIMYHPFDKFYTQDTEGFTITSTDKLGDFRKFIDGYEIYEHPTVFGTDSQPENDEFFATSLTTLSPAIYGGREDDSNNNSVPSGYFPFHKGKKAANETYYYPTSVDEKTWIGTDLIQFAVTSKDDAGNRHDRVVYLNPSTHLDGYKTGQAIGSVHDFFSPPDTNSSEGLDGVKFVEGKGGTAGFFPVTGSCQQNWLVVFCAGNSAVPGYEPYEAVWNLFNKTRTMRGRKWVPEPGGDVTMGEWQAASYDMDSGVRTLVVGFIPDEEPGEYDTITDMRDKLTLMAQYGDPILSNGQYIPNPDAKPYFANDVQGLIEQLNKVLERITAEQMGSGEAVNMPSSTEDETGKNTRVLFGASYKMKSFNQWNAWLTKYTVTSDDEKISTDIDWEANGLLEAKTERDLYTFVAAEGTSGSATDTREINEDDYSIMNIPAAYNVSFDTWLRKYDKGNDTANTGILGDMVHSGITVVREPKNIPDTDDKNRPHIVYTQTNRGVLHAFDYGTGNERWGFIPPNIFQGKLKSLKFDGNNEWINGDGVSTTRSEPMYLLDGMLIAKDIIMSPENRTYLTGYLGNGGNGFYTMDITTGGTPNFRWAIENARYSDTPEGTSAEDTVKRWGAAATEGGNYAYQDLGLTIVPGVYFDPIGSIDSGSSSGTVGVLPGGLGHNLSNDVSTHGKAFYIFNPSTGSIWKKIDSNSQRSTDPDSNSNADFIAPTGTNLGMGISPVVYHDDKSGKATEFYTADSEGNMLFCDTTEDVSDWALQSVFQLRTLGTDDEYYDRGGFVTTKFQKGSAVAIPRRMTFATSGAYKWLFGGTSNIYGPGSGVNDTYEACSKLNGEQFIFGVNLTSALASGDNAGKFVERGITPSHDGVTKLTYYEDGIPELQYGSYGADGYEYDYRDIKAKGRNMSNFGWVMRLRPAIEGKTDGEYLSAEPLLYRGVLYVATFIPRVKTNTQEVCEDIGVGKLYFLDPATGLSLLEVPAYVLENVQIAGLSGSDGNITVTVKELALGALEIAEDKLGGDIIDSEAGVMTIRGWEPADSDLDPLSFIEDTPLVQYWREDFR